MYSIYCSIGSRQKDKPYAAREIFERRLFFKDNRCEVKTP